MTAKEKNKLAGIFLLAHGGLMGLMYLAMLAFFALIFTADPHVPKIFFGFISLFILVVGAVFVLPQIIGGWKMYKEHPNAKNWGIAASIIACMNAPLGTAAGVFSLIFLFSEEGNRFYNDAASKNYLNSPNEVDDFKYRNFQQQQKEPYDWK
ncbi:MAG TPA: hypothetical protein VF692_15455 [Pyrinomonadaceae bacterium]|jgi:hypothetical protein